MGLFRKMASMSTAGAIDFRSAKDRTARKSAKAARASKVSAREATRQTELLQRQTQLMERASLEARLAKVDELHRKGLITADEHTAARAEILAS